MIEVSFTEPHHPGQRPATEAFNGLARHYGGTGTHLAVELPR